MIPYVIVPFIVGLTQCMTQVFMDLKGRRDNISYGDLFGRYDPICDLKHHGNLRGRGITLRDPKGHGDLDCRFYIVYESKRSR